MRELGVVRTGFSCVKGTRHLAQGALAWDDAGPAGDRRLCLADPGTGAVLRTVQHPSLVTVEARILPGDEDSAAGHPGAAALTVLFPGGRTLTGPLEVSGRRLNGEYWRRPIELEPVGGDFGEAFSDFLGREAVLARVPPRAAVYGAGVSIVTTASIAELAARTGADHPQIDARRFRATYVLETDAPHAEETWEGELIDLAGTVLRVGGPIPRCAVIDIDPETGARGSRLLQTLSGYRPRSTSGEPCFGVYAEPV